MYLQISARESTEKETYFFFSSSILNLNYSQQPLRSFCANLDIIFQLSTLKVLMT